MDIADKFVYLIGPLVVAVTLYVRYKWRRLDQKKSQGPFE